MPWTDDGEWIPEETPAFYQGTGGGGDDEELWGEAGYWSEPSSPALSAPAWRSMGATSGGESTLGNWSTTPPASTPSSPSTGPPPGYRVKYNAMGVAVGIEPIGSGGSSGSSSRTVVGQKLGGGGAINTPSGGLSQALAPPNESIYSYTQTAPTTITGSSTTSGTSITGPSTSTQTTGPSSSSTVVKPQTTLQSSTSNTMSRRIPTMALPKYQETPALTLPERDRMRERVLAQEESALGVGEWRQSLRQGLNKIMSEGNFASRGAQLRQMLSGAGQGLGRILQAANSSARAQYNAEYQNMVTAAVENYRGQLSEHMAQFQSAVGMYLGTMDTETTQSGTQTSKTSGGGSTTKTSGGTVTGTTSGGTVTTTGQTGTTQNTSGGGVFSYKGSTPYTGTPTFPRAI